MASIHFLRLNVIISSRIKVFLLHYAHTGISRSLGWTIIDRLKLNVLHPHIDSRNVYWWQ